MREASVPLGPSVSNQHAPLKILFVATQLPVPADTGGKIRTLNVVRHLAHEHDLTFISTVDLDTEEKVLEEMRRVCPRFIAIPHRHYHRTSWRYFLKLLVNFASPYPFGVAKDYSRALAREIRHLAERDFDVLVCDFLHASINLQYVDSLPTVLFQHNVEAEIFRRHYLQQRNWLARLFWLYQWKKMRRYEGSVSRQLDCCIAVSETDKDRFQKDYRLTNVSTIDTGVDVGHFGALERRRVPQRLVFTGSMDWLPNEDGMLWFVREVFPAISQAVPGASLAIVGRRPGRKIQRLSETDPQVIVTGRVEDVRPYLAEGSVFIVPLRIGGGTRIKIFEAMAAGIPVVSTTIGAEGLRVEDGRHLLLANDASTFVQSVITLLRNPDRALQIAGAAKTLVMEKYDWKIISQQFSAICRKTVAHKKGS